MVMSFAGCKGDKDNNSSNSRSEENQMPILADENDPDGGDNVITEDELLGNTGGESDGDTDGSGSSNGGSSASGGSSDNGETDGSSGSAGDGSTEDGNDGWSDIYI